MARRKNYYGYSNKSADAGQKLLFEFLKIGAWAILVLFTMLVQIAESLWQWYKNRKITKNKDKCL